MNRYFMCIFLCYIFQMGFIQLNEDFIFIEPLNDTVAITGHPHRVYRRKRSMEEKVTEKSVPHSHYCGVISGNALSWKGLIKYAMWDESWNKTSHPPSLLPSMPLSYPVLFFFLASYLAHPSLSLCLSICPRLYLFFFNVESLLVNDNYIYFFDLFSMK